MHNAKNNKNNHDNIDITSDDDSQVDPTMSNVINRQILKKNMKLKAYTSSREEKNN